MHRSSKPPVELSNAKEAYGFEDTILRHLAAPTGCRKLAYTTTSPSRITLWESDGVSCFGTKPIGITISYWI
ncbi:hypothetical protein DUI87_06592 [Hirundo rustica rustica]|uniref:Uncharacterized protein n=1 Tax=Hirundo rustica rustica TaxID=333673 RepID=A0A3M0KTZ4_HIRRU|nr:hypothetical protein DUI87_06592 [Hirundo rustica rustica]